jgi:hypothetical protein
LSSAPARFVNGPEIEDRPEPGSFGPARLHRRMKQRAKQNPVELVHTSPPVPERLMFAGCSGNPRTAAAGNPVAVLRNGHAARRHDERGGVLILMC